MHIIKQHEHVIITDTPFTEELVQSFPNHTFVFEDTKDRTSPLNTLSNTFSIATSPMKNCSRDYLILAYDLTQLLEHQGSIILSDTIFEHTELIKTAPALASTLDTFLELLLTQKEYISKGENHEHHKTV